MKLKINRELLPIKAHYFFFFAALGPLLPQMNVFGRQLGVSPGAMGLVTAVLPLLWALAKPVFGYLVDYFTTPPPIKEMESPLYECICKIFLRAFLRQRKLIFMCLIILMTSSYCGLWLVQNRTIPTPAEFQEYQMKDVLLLEKIKQNTTVHLEKYLCHWNCVYHVTFVVFLTNSSSMDTLYLRGNVTEATCETMLMVYSHNVDDKVVCVPRKYCDFFCHRYSELKECSRDSEVNETDRGIVFNGNCTHSSDLYDDDYFGVANTGKVKVKANLTKQEIKEVEMKLKNHNINDTNNMTESETLERRNDGTTSATKEDYNGTDILNYKKDGNELVTRNKTENAAGRASNKVDSNNSKVILDGIESSNDISIDSKDLHATIVDNTIEISNTPKNLVKRQTEVDFNAIKKTKDSATKTDLSIFKAQDVKDDVNTDFLLPKVVILCHDRRENDDQNDSNWDDKLNLYTTFVFWWFVVLMCVGTVAFNVANCIGDAICFDVLGPERASRYGAQRAWGTIGYGTTALLGGWLVDRASTGIYKNFTPAFILATVFTVLDLMSCKPLKLPPLSSPKDGGKALWNVLRIPRMMLFIGFAAIVGTFDSFIIYYMFWYLEELGEVTGHTAKIKFIEGIVVAAESFVGELLFFFFSGKIIKRWGYTRVMSFCMCCYGVRLFMISLITNPWQLVFIEGIMQGPTYALCYASIVGYAAVAAPPGYSATVQGLLAGVDDGLGFSIGSLVGGLLYGAIGGRRAFQMMSLVAVVAGVMHVVLSWLIREDLARKPPLPPVQDEDEKFLPSPNTSSAIYNDTVMPLKSFVNTQSNKDGSVTI